MQNDAKRFRNLHGCDVAPHRFEVVKVRVVPAALLPLVATLTSHFGGIFKEERVSMNLTMTLIDI